MPPEIRNEVYAYAFLSDGCAELSLEPHPLSLLLACQRTYLEASILAFKYHIFPLSTSLNPSTFISMRNSTTHLSSSQTHAITTLSYSLRKDYTELHHSSGAVSIIANTILLFPYLKRFEICIPRGKRKPHEMHSSTLKSDSHMYLNAHSGTIENFAPHWFTASLLGPLTQGHAYAWQAGEHWSIKWPQIGNGAYFGVPNDCYPHLTLVMSPDAVGNVRGVHMCPCRCGNVEWTAVDVVQETGRKIAIGAVYYGLQYGDMPGLERDELLKARRGFKAVILKKGSAPLDVVDARSYLYEADDDYWEQIRWRNGDWGTIWRGVWKHLPSQTTEDSLPGSMSLHEGDWARFAACKEQNKA
jgi:hypothetical protein